MPKVSIIIPVYNRSEKLRRCLDSVLAQTLSDIEIILINDASTDNSYEIMLEYEKKASDRIIVINCETNNRAGGARNIGLDMVSSDFIGFVDSDDYIAKDMFECLYNKAVNEDCDIVDSPVKFISSGRIREPINDEFCNRALSVEEKEMLILSDGYIMTKLFRTSLLNDNMIRFRPHVKLEDADFLLKAFLHAENFGTFHDCKYFYDDEGDINTWSVRNVSSGEFDHILALLEEYGRILKNDPRAKECQAAVKAAILHFYQSGIACCLSDVNNGTSNEMSQDDLMRLISIRNAKNSIFTGGYDNPYFTQVADEPTIDLLNQIDKLSV